MIEFKRVHSPKSVMLHAVFFYLRYAVPTGGKWSRPNISILAIKAFPYLPDRFFDIITFEINPPVEMSVEGVSEALSHQQFANRVHVIFHETSFQISESKGNWERTMSTACKHGIGVIVAEDITNWETWDELVPTTRSQPDSEQANRFIANCFSEGAREQIIKWHK